MAWLLWNFEDKFQSISKTSTTVIVDSSGFVRGVEYDYSQTNDLKKKRDFWIPVIAIPMAFGTLFSTLGLFLKFLRRPSNKTEESQPPRVFQSHTAFVRWSTLCAMFYAATVVLAGIVAPIYMKTDLIEIPLRLLCIPSALIHKLTTGDLFIGASAQFLVFWILGLFLRKPLLPIIVLWLAGTAITSLLMLTHVLP